MAHEQNTNVNDQPGGPFTRPAFLVSAGLVALIVVLGVVVTARVASKTDATTAPPASTSPVASPSSSGISDPSASVCGLPGPGDNQPLTAAPAAVWQYEGVTAYPTSPQFGPAKTADRGYRFCFQHGEAGAVVASANALAVPNDGGARQAWVEYFVSSGPNRTKLLDELGSDPSSNPTGIRVRVVGFKVLSYSDSAARIDIAVEASGQAQTVTGSYVYELTWQSGDWKLNSDAPTPFNFSTISSAAGYIPWSA